MRQRRSYLRRHHGHLGGEGTHFRRPLSAPCRRLRICRTEATMTAVRPAGEAAVESAAAVATTAAVPALRVCCQKGAAPGTAGGTLRMMAAGSAAPAVMAGGPAGTARRLPSGWPAETPPAPVPHAPAVSAAPRPPAGSAVPVGSGRPAHRAGSASAGAAPGWRRSTAAA